MSLDEEGLFDPSLKDILAVTGARGSRMMPMVGVITGIGGGVKDGDEKREGGAAHEVGVASPSSSDEGDGGGGQPTTGIMTTVGIERSYVRSGSLALRDDENIIRTVKQ